MEHFPSFMFLKPGNYDIIQVSQTMPDNTLKAYFAPKFGSKYFNRNYACTGSHFKLLLDLPEGFHKISSISRIRAILKSTISQQYSISW